MQQSTFLFLLQLHHSRCYELLAYWQPFDFCHFNNVQFNELSPTSAELYNYYVRINTCHPLIYFIIKPLRLIINLSG